jgi:hypothetical protein
LFKAPKLSRRKKKNHMSDNKKEKKELIPYTRIPYRVIIEILNEFYWFDYISGLIEYVNSEKGSSFSILGLQIFSRRFFNMSALYGYFKHDRQRKIFQVYKSIDITTSSFESDNIDSSGGVFDMLCTDFDCTPTRKDKRQPNLIWFFVWECSKNYKLLQSLKYTKMSNLLISNISYDFVPKNLDRFHTRQTKEQWRMPHHFQYLIVYFNNITLFGYGLIPFSWLPDDENVKFLKKACEKCKVKFLKRREACSCWGSDKFCMSCQYHKNKYGCDDCKIRECFLCKVYKIQNSCDKCETTEWDLVFDSCVFDNLTPFIYDTKIIPKKMFSVCKKIYSEWVSQLSNILKMKELKEWKLNLVNGVVSEKPDMVPSSLRYNKDMFLLPKFSTKVGNFNIRFKNLIFK